MLKKSLIMISIFLYLSILITGSPFKIDISSYGNNPFFSLDNVNQFVYAQQGGSDNSSDGGSDNSSDGGSDNSSDGGSDNSSDGGSDNSSDGGSDNSSDGGSDNSRDGGNDKREGGANDQTEGKNKETPVGGDNTPPVGGDNPPPVGGDNPPPVGGDNPPPVRVDNPEPSKDKNNIKDKINFEFEKITKIISKTKTKVIVKDDSNSEKEIIIVSDPTCPTQSETVELNGMIDAKGIRLLANFYPCIIQNGGITMNIPESPHLNLALIYIDNNIDNHAGTLISPSKIQSIDKNQGLFSIELDKKMEGNDPITGELTTLEKI